MASGKANMEAVETGLEELKRLLVLMLIKMGTPQAEIALALGVDQSSVSRMFPTRKVRKFENVN